MKTKTNVRAGGRTPNHNETLSGGLRLTTHLKAGIIRPPMGNHNETLRDGLKLRTHVRAGGIGTSPNCR